jgi:DNA-binding NtrC family response regulator
MRGAGSRQERGPRRGEDAVREAEPAGLARPEEQAASPDERTRVLEALERAGGNQSKAATILGVSRRTLINRLEHFALPRPRKGRSRSPL